MGRGGIGLTANAALSTCLDPKLWGRYLGQAYQQGVTKAFNEVHRPQQARVANQDGALVYHGARQQFTANTLRSSAPATLNKVWLEYNRRCRQVLNGLQLHNADFVKVHNQIATLARLGVVRAHAEGQLDGYRALGVRRVKQVADKAGCAHLHNTVHNLAEVRGSIPRHVTCRCAWLPADNVKQPLAVNRSLSPLEAFSELLANYSLEQARDERGRFEGMGVKTVLSDPFNRKYEFVSGGSKYSVSASTIGGGAWHMQFSNVTSGRNEEKLTGDAGAKAVGTMRTIGSVADHFLQEVKPRELTFTADAGELSRVKLYDRTSGLLAKRNGYHLARSEESGIDGDEVVYRLTRSSVAHNQRQSPTTFATDWDELP